MLFIIVQPLVLGYGQSVGTIVEASDWPEGQEHAAQAVGGQEALRRENFNLSFWACKRLDFGTKHQVFGYCESFGTISWGPRLTWRLRTHWKCCRRFRSTPWSKLLTQLLSMLETWVWCRTSGFRASGSFGTISWGPRLTCRLWTHCMSSRRSLNSLRSNSASGYTETLFPVESHVFG